MSPPSNVRWILIVVVFSTAVLSYGLADNPLGSGWIDPVKRLGAQDESVYTHEAIQMLVSGEILSAKLLGRYIFEKPPLLPWLSALSMWLFGIGPLGARVPALLSGVFLSAICFITVSKFRGVALGLLASVLCVSNSLLFTMARHNMTDILVSACGAACFLSVLYDPALQTKRARWGLTASVTAGVLLKSLAGMLPVVAVCTAAGFLNERRNGGLRRAVQCCGLGVLLAAPWFVYQLSVHSQWLLADLEFQFLKVGLSPQQTSDENHLAFYLRRFWYAGPIAALLMVAAIVRITRAARQRESAAVLTVAFIGTFAAAIAMFSFHSQQYLTPLLPFVIIAGTLFSPLLDGRKAGLMVAVGVAALLTKTIYSEEPWGLEFRSQPSEVTNTLRTYCAEFRGNDLYVIDVNDEFYATVLPLSKVRYGWVLPEDSIRQSRPHLLDLGIVQSIEPQADDSLFRRRMEAWGLNSDHALRTAIIAPSLADFKSLISSNPDADFLISGDLAFKSGRWPNHRTRIQRDDHVLLLAHSGRPADPRRWRCQM